MKRGFATIVVAIVIICVILGAAGAYVALKNPSQKASIFNDSSSQSGALPSPGNSQNVSTAPTSASVSSVPATQSASAQPTISSREVRAAISVLTNYKGNSLRVLATCSVNTKQDIYGFAFYPGDTSVSFDGSTDPTPKTKTTDFTYQAPGTYTLECLPSYQNGKINSSEYIAAYGAKKTITVGGYTAPSQNNITFTFSPTTGTLPLKVNSACRINTTGSVTALAIGVDDPNQMDISGGETFTDKYLVYKLDSNGAAVGTSASYNDTLAASKYWRGSHNVYCMATINNGSPIISKPIPVDFQ